MGVRGEKTSLLLDPCFRRREEPLPERLDRDDDRADGGAEEIQGDHHEGERGAAGTAGN